MGSPTQLPPDLRVDLEQRGILRIEETRLPPTLAVREKELGKSLLRAASHSILRKRLAVLCDARICLGGKFRTYQGFWPGILEEALLSAAKPKTKVLLSTLMGGAARKIVRTKA